jgi:single-stranded DNA-specific DHH superfamily exonuclease
MNIRAEQRQCRDLMQDLQDIRDGINIFYDDEIKKDQKQRKKEAREKSRKKKIQKLEKKLIEIGYENLDSYEQQRIHKYIDSDRLCELIKNREQRLKEEREKPVQLSIFDMIGGKTNGSRKERGIDEAD